MDFQPATVRLYCSNEKRIVVKKASFQKVVLNSSFHQIC